MQGLLVVDKPEGFTSHDVVAKLRGLFSLRRIGHGGTLDPMATGVLPVLLGKATKASAYLLGDKTYVACFCTGLTTDTYDSAGQILTQSGARPSLQALQAALAPFQGDIVQIPPMVSAVKVRGKKLYEYARAGLEIARPPRTVTIHGTDLVQTDDNQFTLTVRCSKGTYVRALIHDLGQAVGGGAVMTALRRTASDPFTIDQALTLSQVQSDWEKGCLAVRPVDVLFAACPAVTLPPGRETDCFQGRPLPLPPSLPVRTDRVRVYDATGRFLQLGRVKDAFIVAETNFFETET